MGKKISKNPHEKKQLNSLIKVLRPKVYITDSSSFKTLVQELTGNGNTNTTVSSPSPPDSTYNPDQTTVDQISIIHIEDDVHVHARETESSLEASSDASTDSSCGDWSNQQVLFPEELEQSYYSQIYLQGESNVTSSEYLFMNQQEEELLSYGDLESWLLDMEPYPLYNTTTCNQIQQEVSIFDYELSGLI